MSIQLIEGEIRRFLSSSDPEVICISGHWGVGKPFAWNRFLKDAQAKKEIALKRYSYVSLFGINSLDEFKYSVFENSVKTSEIGVEPSLETLHLNTLAAADALGESLSQTRNLILVGRNGLGKTMIAQNIAHAAVLAGHTVLFRSAAALLEELHRQSPEGRRHKLRAYANVGLLCVDEFGFDRIERVECPEAAHLLYKIIAARNQKRSTAVVTNVDFEKWGDYLPDGPLAMAFLDRLVERAIILKVTGKSYRAWLAQQAAEAEAAKKVAK